MIFLVTQKELLVTGKPSSSTSTFTYKSQIKCGLACGYVHQVQFFFLRGASVQLVNPKINFKHAIWIGIQ